MGRVRRTNLGTLLRRKQTGTFGRIRDSTPAFKNTQTFFYLKHFLNKFNTSKRVLASHQMLRKGYWGKIYLNRRRFPHKNCRQNWSLCRKWQRRVLWLVVPINNHGGGVTRRLPCSSRMRVNRVNHELERRNPPKESRSRKTEDTAHRHYPCPPK